MLIIHMLGQNGNIYKGNRQQKEERRKKNKEQHKKSSIVNSVSGDESYAFVDSLLGGKHVRVTMIDGADNKSVIAVIPGRFYKRVWFKKDDVVIVSENGNLREIKGKASESEASTIRSKFGRDKDSNALVFEDVITTNPGFDTYSVKDLEKVLTIDDI